MTSKERVLTAFARREPDRVPINYMANPGIDARLKRHFGLAADDAEGLRQALGVDFRPAGGCSYRGPTLHAPSTVAGVVVDGLWGQRRRWVAHEAGGCCFAPTHMLQDNSPTENVVAMYEAARAWTRAESRR